MHAAFFSNIKVRNCALGSSLRLWQIIPVSGHWKWSDICLILIFSMLHEKIGGAWYTIPCVWSCCDISTYYEKWHRYISSFFAKGTLWLFSNLLRTKKGHTALAIWLYFLSVVSRVPTTLLSFDYQCWPFSLFCRVMSLSVRVHMCNWIKPTTLALQVMPSQ